MRVITFLVALGLLVGAGTAWACPMQNAAKDQNLASSNGGSSTPIPAKSRQDQKS